MLIVLNHKETCVQDTPDPVLTCEKNSQAGSYKQFLSNLHEERRFDIHLFDLPLHHKGQMKNNSNCCCPYN